jgi:hypothetical protein
MFYPSPLEGEGKRSAGEGQRSDEGRERGILEKNKNRKCHAEWRIAFQFVTPAQAEVQAKNRKCHAEAQSRRE